MRNKIHLAYFAAGLFVSCLCMSPQTVFPFNCSRLALDDTKNVLHYVYVMDSALWTATMQTDGNNWSATERFDPGEYGIDNVGVNLALDPEAGKLHYSFGGDYFDWRSETAGSRIWTAMINTEGTDWSIQTRYQDNSYPSFYPYSSLALDEFHHKVYFFFSRWDSYIYTMNTDGTDYQQVPVAFPPSLRIFPGPEMAIDNTNNKLYLAYITPDLTIARMNFDGSNFEVVKETTCQLGPTEDQSFHFVLDAAAGKIYLAYYISDANVLYTAKLNTDGSGWSSQRLWKAFSIVSPRLALSDARDKLYLIFCAREAWYEDSQLWTAEIGTDLKGWFVTQRTYEQSSCDSPDLVLDSVAGKIYYVFNRDSQIWTAEMSADRKGWSVQRRTGAPSPVHLNVDRRIFSSCDQIKITADIEAAGVPVYPFVRIKYRYLTQGEEVKWGTYYLTRDGKFSLKPISYLKGGPFSINSAINDYQILNTFYSNLTDGSYQFEAGFVDGRKPYIGSEINYYGGIDYVGVEIQ